jgi:integrase
MILTLRAEEFLSAVASGNGQEVSTKTKKGYREVNIEPALVSMLTAHLDGRKAGRVFQTRNGTPFCKSNVRHKPREILKKLNLPTVGLHAFRHGRVSVLQANGVPGDLVKEWVGHSSLRTTSGYTHFRDDFRTRTAGKVGLFVAENLAKNCQMAPMVPILPELQHRLRRGKI